MLLLHFDDKICLVQVSANFVQRQLDTWRGIDCCAGVLPAHIRWWVRLQKAFHQQITRGSLLDGRLLREARCSRHFCWMNIQKVVCCYSLALFLLCSALFSNRFWLSCFWGINSVYMWSLDKRTMMRVVPIDSQLVNLINWTLKCFFVCKFWLASTQCRLKLGEKRTLVIVATCFLAHRALIRAKWPAWGKQLDFSRAHKSMRHSVGFWSQLNCEGRI